MTRKVKTITHNGETLTVYQWAKRVGCSHQTIASRLKSGWTPDKIINTPVGSYRRHAKTKAAFNQLVRDIDQSLREFAREVDLIE